jgi:O-antigen ligase
MPAHVITAFRAAKAGLEQRSLAHTFALALVWLALATSGLVFSEPSPTDLITLALIVLLPVIGLVRIGPALGCLLLAFGAAAALALVSSASAFEINTAVKHTLVTLYLYGGTIVLAGFIAAKPEAHAKLMFNGLTAAATIACATGIAGYFGLIPNAEMFTKFGRATGTFKDPNVFGPFLVPPMLYALQLALDRSLKRSLPPLLLAGLLALGVFLSFSRGAWVNILIALAVYIVLAFLTAASNARRQKLVFLGLACAALAAAVIAGALQVEKVSALVTERASVSQSYDAGPEGRFGGQQKAVALILENPLGIGAQQFAAHHHHEAVHNVYLSMALNAGWLGAGLFAIATVLTLLVGIMSAFKRTAAQPFLLIAVAAFAANAFEGVIIDTDHWRHFYLLMAFVWGIATAPAVQIVIPQSLARPARGRFTGLATA